MVDQACQVILLIQQLFHFVRHALSGPCLAFSCSMATRQRRYVKMVNHKILADQPGEGMENYETAHGALEAHRHLTSPVLLLRLRVQVTLDDFGQAQPVYLPV